MNERSAAERLAELKRLADSVGEPGWTVLDGRDFEEHGPGFHVMGAEGETLSVKLGSHDAPGRAEARARAQALRDLLEEASDPDPSAAEVEAAEPKNGGEDTSPGTVSVVMLNKLVRAYLSAALHTVVDVAEIPQNVRPVVEEAMHDDAFWSGEHLPLDRLERNVPSRYDGLLDRAQLSELVRDLLFGIVCATRVWLTPHNVRQMLRPVVGDDQFWSMLRWLSQAHGRTWNG